MPNWGSEPGYGWNWATHLGERGINVTVLTRDVVRPAIETHLREHPIENVTFEYLAVPTPLFKHGTAAHYFLWQCLAIGRARALHRVQSFDVVHHVTYTSVHIPTQLWRLGIPTVFGPVGGGQTTPRSMLPYFGSTKRAEERRTFLTRALRHSPLHRRWLGKMAVIYASNSDTVALVRALGRSDVMFKFDVGVCREYLAGEARAFKGDAGPLRLIWVGRMLPRKALTLALDALTHVQHSFVLTIVGNGLPEHTVWRLIAERGLADCVNWSNRRLTVAEVRAAYLDHDALLFTSIRETAGVQLLEAMALGLPIITLDLHGARDLVPEAAGMKIPVTIPVEVARNLAAAIDQFASLSAEQKNGMSRAGWEFASTNTWTCRAAQAEALYAELLNTTTGGRLPQSASPAISTAERLDLPL